MYIQITTRCNMTCDHCCFDCTEKGDDMSFETFKKAVEFDSECIAIGGGEPTVHPNFEKMLLHAITNVDYVWLATNGKETNTALLLSKLAKKGVIACELSQDNHHEQIDQKVIKAFDTDEENSNDQRGIRNVSGREVDAGRCKDGRDGCACEDIMIKPNGDIKQCGCPDSPTIGNINDRSFPVDYETGCHKVT